MSSINNKILHYFTNKRRKYNKINTINLPRIFEMGKIVLNMMKNHKTWKHKDQKSYFSLGFFVGVL
ncbi:hypothetical protein CSA56_04675 [candidate division KSB3 bacterium]|uniref:Uncharacterized protein n=1 Tax=candidate division KSB3 bacterium TaxID=2044937 RepID=A0A2G6KI27_9BACT|nr:MAG: hypothetical protein CSA56_04675 [candidate division KSB3 bacterium]